MRINQIVGLGLTTGGKAWPEFRFGAAAQQLSVGLQASGILPKAARLDISKQAEKAAKAQLAAYQTETSVWPASATLPVRDDEKKRRLPWFFPRRKSE